MFLFIFYGLIWIIMITYFYVVNITKVSHKLLTSLMVGCYYIYYRAYYASNKKNKNNFISNGLEKCWELYFKEKKNLSKLIKFEKNLAKKSFTNLENRDPQNLYNKTTVKKFKKISNLNWDIFFRHVTDKK